MPKQDKQKDKAELYALTPICASEILGLFKSRPKMFRRLETNAVTFKLVGNDKPEGAQKETVTKIVKNLFEVLRHQNLNNFLGDDDLYGFVADNLYQKYAADISKLNYANCIVVKAKPVSV